MDVLIDATVQIDRAIAALARKTDPQTSKNIFLVIHPFDGLAVAAYDEPLVIGHQLPDVDAAVKLDTLWILWHPGMLAMWSQRDRRWTDVLFDAGGRLGQFSALVAGLAKSRA